jgi:hypothetical protein
MGSKVVSRLAVNCAANIGTTVITARILAVDGSRWQFLRRASLYGCGAIVVAQDLEPISASTFFRDPPRRDLASQ